MADSNWIRIAGSPDELSFSEADLCAVSAGDRKICLARKNGNLIAFQGLCPHAGADLSCGSIDSLGNLVCPLHRYTFSLINGRNVSGEGYFLKRYPVEIREDGIYILAG